MNHHILLPDFDTVSMITMIDDSYFIYERILHKNLKYENK